MKLFDREIRVPLWSWIVVCAMLLDDAVRGFRGDGWDVFRGVLILVAGTLGIRFLVRSMWRAL